MTESIYFPVGIWSKDGELAYKKASEKYDELKGLHEEIYLVMSSHPYSEGYWIEFKKPENLLGYIIKRALN
jgi:hypothetical protein